MNEENNPEYAWREATKGDVGRLAKFGDTRQKHEPVVYGILKSVEFDDYSFNGDIIWTYYCEHGCGFEGDAEEGEIEGFCFCWVQYDKNEEP